MTGLGLVKEIHSFAFCAEKEREWWLQAGEGGKKSDDIFLEGEGPGVQHRTQGLKRNDNW